MTKCLLTLSNWIQKFLQGILLIIGTLLTAVNIAQIVGREIHFSLPWSEQLSTWLLIWTIFLGYHLVIKNDAELTIDAIHFKNHTAQLLLEILRDFLSLTMIVVFLIASTQFLQNSMIYPQKLSSMPVNMYVIYYGDAGELCSDGSSEAHQYGCKDRQHCKARRIRKHSR